MVEIGFSVVVAAILALLAPQTVNLFMHDAAIIESGSLMLRCMLISTPLIGVVLVFTTLFPGRGEGRTGAFTLQLAVRACSSPSA